LGLALVGGDVGELGGEHARGDADFRGEDAGFGNVEVADTLGDDPAVGGAHGPELDAQGVKGFEQGADFGEDAVVDVGAEVFGGGGAEFLLAEAFIELDHFAADDEFADGAGEVGAVAVVDPVAGGAGDEALFDGPVHESVA